VPYTKVKNRDHFWSPKLEMNASHALLHQWQQLENSGCIQNFRLVADKATPGIRKGWFFADSDAYKWLEAVVIGYAQLPSAKLLAHIDDFIALLHAAQQSDGYLYTYNQLLFPDSRWENLQIEHELYCHGHLIEAAVSHFQVTADNALLEAGSKAANLIVDNFRRKDIVYSSTSRKFRAPNCRPLHMKQPRMVMIHVILPTSLFTGNGIMTIKGKTTTNLPVRFIPYAWWANRAISPMTVFVALEN